MKLIKQKCFLLCLLLFAGVSTFSQTIKNHLPVANKMFNDQSQNKEIVRTLYDSVLNKGQLAKLPNLISENYLNVQGAKGIGAFQKSILELSKAFSEAQWSIVEIFADGDKVIVKQKFTGTQKNQFQNIPPTNKTVSVDGIAIYEFQDKKIIRSEIQTDRLGFLQQLGVLPSNISEVFTNPKR